MLFFALDCIIWQHPVEAGGNEELALPGVGVGTAPVGTAPVGIAPVGIAPVVHVASAFTVRDAGEP